MFRHQDRSTRRAGVTAVEFALTLTIVAAMFFAALEFGRIGMVQASVDDAAYAACRHVIVPGANRAEAETAAMGVLGAVGLESATINVTPATITETTEFVTVSVSLPMDENSWIAPFFTRGLELNGSATLHTERAPASQANALLTPTSSASSSNSSQTTNDGVAPPPPAPPDPPPPPPPPPPPAPPSAD